MAASTIAKKVWRFIESLGPGVIFTTRHLLSLAKRNTVDKILSRFRRKKLISRLADGVFMLPDENAETPSAWEIMQAKAKAFHKRVCKSSRDTQVFDTDGCRSSFSSIHGRLHFRAVSPRKLRQHAQSDSKRYEPTQKPIVREIDTRIINQKNLQEISLFSLMNKMQDLLASAEARLKQHSIKRSRLRHSVLLQHF